ncbi:MAG: hypothetical protein MI725_14575 [Pirellulales bacterium]|nr:hypothetical protein [Pirellulales bacterium]
MARTYAVVMALLGMVVVLLRGVKEGAEFDGTIVASLAWMALLGAIGMIVGALAETTLVESVRTKIEAELHEAES